MLKLWLLLSWRNSADVSPRPVRQNYLGFADLANVNIDNWFLLKWNLRLLKVRLQIINIWNCEEKIVFHYVYVFNLKWYFGNFQILISNKLSVSLPNSNSHLESINMLLFSFKRSFPLNKIQFIRVSVCMTHTGVGSYIVWAKSLPSGAWSGIRRWVSLLVK